MVITVDEAVDGEQANSDAAAASDVDALAPIPPEADDTTDRDELVPDPVALDGPDDTIPLVEDVADEAEPLDNSGGDTPPPGADGGGDAVDELFARIKADRAESVAKANAVLGEPAPASATKTATVDTIEPSHASDVDQVPAEYLADAAQLSARSTAIDEVAPSLNKSLKRCLADEQNDVLDTLRRHERTDLVELFGEVDAHIAEYARAARAGLTTIAAAAAGVVSGGNESTSPVAGVAWDLGAAIVQPFRRRVERAIADVDGDAGELDERLRALYREWKVSQIEELAADAMLSAYAVGTYSAAPDDASFRWLIDPAQGPCPDAQDNALAGPVQVGNEFPTGDTCPQAHPGCRCLLSVD